MPTCFCTARGCRDANGAHPSTGEPIGRIISYNAWKAHSLDEKALEAEFQAQATEDNQINQLSYFLAANTLNDKVSGPSASLGGRLWGNDPSDSDILLNDLSQSHPIHSGQSKIKEQRHPTQGNASASKISPHTLARPLNSAPHRSRESELLKCLSALRDEINHFSQEVDANLQGLSRPSSKGSPIPFPLHAFIDKSSTLYERLDVITFKGQAVVSLKESIKTELNKATERLQDAQTMWNARLSKIKRLKTPSYGLFFDAAHHYEPILPKVDPVLHLTFFMTIVCEIVLGVSRRGCTFLLRMVQYIITLTVLRAGSHISQSDQQLLSNIPVDIRRVEAQFHLKPNCIIIAVCPNQDCHATYTPTFANHSPVPIYPENCTHRQLKGAQPCGTELLKPRRIQGQTVYLPIKTFVKNDFKDWLSGLLSRTGFEEKMDGAWERIRQQHGVNDGGLMSDIFDGDILRNFKGSDGQHFSMGGEEGRYVFSLCVDYFNPLGNKQAGKKKSVGMVSLICLNLPPDMRYKPENMFLYGIIPGPQEPPLACLNHYLRFLVDEFLEFWSPGVQFSRTSQFYYGRVVYCALVCLVCDLLGARKTTGFAGVRHNQICALCHCTRQHHGYGDTNIHSWQRRTNQEYRDSARRYQNATTHQERAGIVAETGIRWSELLRLPYFDPSRFVVVDAMHNLFLGLVQEHFEILGIKLDQKEEDAVAVDIIIRPDLLATLDAASKKSMTRLLRILRSPLKAKLHDRSEYEDCLKKIHSCHLSTLITACTSLNIVPLVPQEMRKKTKFNKMDYAKRLLSWRLSEPEHSLDGPTFRKGCILHEEEVETIRTDIANMVTPSWLTSVPHDLGEPRHGKLKADQWRTLATTYLPISLMRMWGNFGENSDHPSPSPRHQKLLDATLSLISAVIIATSRTTSGNKADLYLQHMQSYIHLIHELIPDYNFRPNHHMALHLAEYLRLFGPVNAWWTFPFERLIGMLQRTTTNFKMGELEQTMMMSFAKSANLRALLLKDNCPPAIRNCQHYFTKLINPDIRNSTLIDFSLFLDDLENDPPEFDPPPESGRRVEVSESTYKALRIYFTNSVPQILHKRTFYVHDGRTFSTASRHKGNSSILVKSANGLLIPAQIEAILQISSTDVVFVVCHYHKANIQDPFLKYPFLHISLWSTSQGNAVIIRLDDIASHFANISFVMNANEYLAVVSLSREY